MADTASIETDLDRLNQAIGARLRVARKVRGLTQTALGDILGVTFRQVQKYENGSNRLSAASLARVCAVLNWSPVEMLGAGDRAGRDTLDLVLASGFEDVMVRVSRLTDAQKALAKKLFVSLLDSLEEPRAPSR